MSVTVDTRGFKRAADVALACVARDDTRPVLACVSAETVDGHLRLAGADGFVCSYAEIPAKGRLSKLAPLAIGKPFKAALKGLKNGKVELSAAMRTVSFPESTATSYGGYSRAVTVKARTEEVAILSVNGADLPCESGQFPDYRRITPSEWAYQAAVPVAWLMDAIGPKNGPGELRTWTFRAEGRAFTVRPGIIGGIDRFSTTTEHAYTGEPAVLPNAIETPPEAPVPVMLNTTMTRRWLTALAAAGCAAVLIMPTESERPVLFAAMGAGGMRIKILQMPTQIAGGTP